MSGNAQSAHAREVELAPDLALSRPAAAAQRLGDTAPDRHRFHKKRVLITGDPDVLTTANGRVMLLNATRLLLRICPNVTVDARGMPPALLAELRAEAARVAFGPPVEIVDDRSLARIDWTHDSLVADGRPDAVLTIGGHVPPGEPWTSIRSDGWSVVVDSIGAQASAHVPARPLQTNAVAALAAASLGVGEVWKRLIALRAERGEPADGTPFCLFTYTSGPQDPGPPIPAGLVLNALIPGVGAIGNGVVAALLELPVRGKVVILDRQHFGRENLGTCLLLGPAGLGHEKARVMADLLKAEVPALDVVPLSGDVAELISEIQQQLPGGPTLVLNGFDNRDARRAVQQLWADLTIDGAIGDFMTQVSRHPGDPDVDVACLRCLYPPDVGPSADLLAARATGLSVERVRDANDVVREDDVLSAPLEQREALQSQLGRRICAVTGAAMVAALSMDRQAEDFEPSVPFVATMSAAMMVGEAVKHSMGVASPLEPRFQFDILRGPAGGLEFGEMRQATCDCVTRRAVIAEFRRRRREGSFISAQ